jgi:hypothetical protein
MEAPTYYDSMFMYLWYFFILPFACLLILVLCCTWCSPRLQSIMDNTPKSSPSSPSRGSYAIQRVTFKWIFSISCFLKSKRSVFVGIICVLLRFFWTCRLPYHVRRCIWERINKHMHMVMICSLDDVWRYNFVFFEMRHRFLLSYAHILQLMSYFSKYDIKRFFINASFISIHPSFILVQAYIVSFDYKYTTQCSLLI